MSLREPVQTEEVDVSGVAPPAPGLTSLCWRFGHEYLGATTWLATGRRWA